MTELIYKYSNLENAIEVLKDNCVKLEYPKNYNDPFDSQIGFDDKDIKKAKSIIREYLTTQELYKLFTSEINKFKQKDRVLISIARTTIWMNMSSAEMSGIYKPNALIKGLINHAFKKAEIEKSFKEAFDEQMLERSKRIRDKALMSCFSKSNKSLLMWSHYADSHKGVCIEFDRPEEAKDVQYSKKIQNFDIVYVTRSTIANEIRHKNGKPISYDFDRIFEPFYTKGSDWRYEGEVRCVYDDSDKFGNVIEKEIIKKSGEKGIILVHKMPNPVKRVYLGCKIDKNSDNYKKLVEIANKKNIELIEMKIDEKNYKVFF